MKQVINLILILLLPVIFSSGNVKMQSQIVLYAPDIITPTHKSDWMAPPEQFIWNKVENANYYSIQITTDVTFLTINNITDLDIQSYSDTLYLPPPNYLDKDTMYFWRVKANSNTGAESDWTPIHKFTTGISSIYEMQSNDNIKISPLPIKNTATISLDFNKLKIAENASQMKILVFNNAGRIIDSVNVNNITNESKILFDANNYDAGNYHLVFVCSNKVFASKAIIIEK